MQIQTHASVGASPGQACFGRRRDDARLSTLMSSFGERGGVASSDEVISLMRPYWRQPISMLARWIVTRQLVNFTWRTQLLLPLFQFDRPRMTPREGVVDAVRVLAEGLDDEAIALWFVEPNPWLQGASPMSVELSDPDGLLEAARHAGPLRKQMKWPA
jgi:hypothetical protein